MKAVQLDASRVPAITLTEIAFLVSLTSPDSNVSHLAAQGLRLISHAERQPNAPINPLLNDEDKTNRHPMYEQLGDPKIMLVGEFQQFTSIYLDLSSAGRVGHQKRIRKLLRQLMSASAVYIVVWEECYRRWRTLSEIMLESLSESQDGSPRTTIPGSSQVRLYTLVLSIEV